MCDEYRSFNMFVGMKSTGYKGQMTLRGEKNETAEAYAKRIVDEIKLWYGLGWQVERAYFDDGKIVKQMNVETDADLDAAFEAATTKPAGTAPATPAPEGSGMSIMHVQQFKITGDTNGLPVLGFYQTGHKWPDLRYSLGKTMDERKANCAKVLSNIAGPVSPDAIVIGTDKPVSWDVVWRPGRDPKYKDVVSVGPHINGKAA